MAEKRYRRRIYSDFRKLPHGGFTLAAQRPCAEGRAMADFVSPRTRESINGHTILVAPVETTVWLTGEGGRTPTFGALSKTERVG